MYWLRTRRPPRRGPALSSHCRFEIAAPLVSAPLPLEKGEVTQMKRQHITTLVVLAASVFVVSIGLTAQSADRFTLKAANGIAFSEFRGYDAWQLIATSQPDDASGCGTSKVGCMKAILGNPTMIKAYRDGIPANGKAVPDGAALGKIEWLQGPRREALRRDGVRSANRDVLHGEGLEAIPGHERMGLRHVRIRRIVGRLQAVHNQPVIRTGVPRVSHCKCEGA